MRAVRLERPGFRSRVLAFDSRKLAVRFLDRLRGRSRTGVLGGLRPCGRLRSERRLRRSDGGTRSGTRVVVLWEVVVVLVGRIVNLKVSGVACAVCAGGCHGLGGILAPRLGAFLEDGV